MGSDSIADPISWNATPVNPAPDAPEAVAMPEAFPAHGRRSCPPASGGSEGLADSGLYFAGEITVTDAAGQVFEVPVGFESEAWARMRPQ